MTLLDALDDETDFADLADLRRIELGDGAWIDLMSGWSRRSTELFETLVDQVPWHAYERKMYGRTVPVPRLIKNYDEGEQLPDQRLTEAASLLNAHYAPLPGSATAEFTRAGLNFYRDGNDSVAWHSDTAGPADEDDTMVGILSLGSPRVLSVRPRGGQVSGRFSLGHGDLLVMGGSFQRTHEHAITKTTRAVGARISIQYRPTWNSAADRSEFSRRPLAADREMEPLSAE